jgi:hypothetical protein
MVSGNHSIVGFDEQGNARCPGCHFVQKFEPLCGQFTSQPSDPSQIALRASEVCDNTKRHRVSRGDENDRDGCGRRLDRKR